MCSDNLRVEGQKQPHPSRWTVAGELRPASARQKHAGQVFEAVKADYAIRILAARCLTVVLRLPRVRWRIGARVSTSDAVAPLVVPALQRTASDIRVRCVVSFGMSAGAV